MSKIPFVDDSPQQYCLASAMELLSASGGSTVTINKYSTSYNPIPNNLKYPFKLSQQNILSNFHCTSVKGIALMQSVKQNVVANNSHPSNG